MDFLLDQLAGGGPVSARKMFGEYCLYYDGKPVGLVCDNQLFLKNTQALRDVLANATEGAPFPGAKPHLRITADQWEDRTALAQWVRTTAQALAAVPGKSPTSKRLSTVPVTQKPSKPGNPSKSDPDAELAELPNLGPKSQQMLTASGIRSIAQLRRLGAVAAYHRVKGREPNASLNLLWALEGALTGLRWQDVARDHRTSLLLALEQLRHPD